jgi:hypothetical protein
MMPYRYSDEPDFTNPYRVGTLRRRTLPWTVLTALAIAFIGLVTFGTLRSVPPAEGEAVALTHRP